MTDTSGNSGRRSGRPRKSEPPRLPYDEVDRLLVFGEVVKTESGESTTVVYPSYREIARRYGVSHSLIAQYSKRHDCLRRRKEAKARIAVKTDQKLVEMRATAIAISKDESLQIIDTYLAGFRDALAEGRVRFDNPTDFDRMCRLKEFMLGGADSRQEIHAALSLEDLQARHQRMLREMRSASSAVRGEVVDAEVVPSLPAGDIDQASGCNSPAPPAEAGPEEVTVQPAGAAPGPAPQAPVSAPGPGAWEDGAKGGAGAPHGRNVAPTAAPPGPPGLRIADAGRDEPAPGAEDSGARAPGELAGASSRGARPHDARGEPREPLADSAENVCALGSAESPQVSGDQPAEPGDAESSPGSADFRRSPPGGDEAGAAAGQPHGVLLRPRGEGVGEGSRGCGEHARDQDETS